MRRALIWALVAAASASAFAAAAPVRADGYETPQVKRPAYRHRAPVPRAYYAPRGRGVAMEFRVDPYLYTYEPRGYYPYYNAGYWRPNCGGICKPYYEQPPYWQAWGYAVPVWVRPYEGRIRRHHW